MMIRDISVPISSEFYGSVNQPIVKKPWRLIIGPQVLNGTFLTEGVGGADVFESWDESFTSSVMTRDTAVYETDGASCKVVGDALNTNFILFMNKDSDGNNILANGDVIRYSARLKASLACTVKIGGNANADQDLINVNTQWQTFTGEITISNGSSLFYYKRNNITNTTVWMDRIEVWRIR